VEARSFVKHTYTERVSIHAFEASLVGGCVTYDTQAPIPGTARSPRPRNAKPCPGFLFWLAEIL